MPITCYIFDGIFFPNSCDILRPNVMLDQMYIILDYESHNSLFLIYCTTTIQSCTHSFLCIAIHVLLLCDFNFYFLLTFLLMCVQETTLHFMVNDLICAGTKKSHDAFYPSGFYCCIML